MHRQKEEILRLQTALDNVGAYVFTKDRDCRYTFANAMTRALFAASLDDIVGCGDDRFFDAASSQAIRENDEHVMRTGERLEREERIAAVSTGELRYYWAVKQPLRDRAGKIVGLIGISTDITERKRAEEALVEAEARFRGLFEQAPLAIWLMDADSRIIECNEKTLEYSGAARDKTIGLRMLTDAIDPVLNPSIRKALAGEPCMIETPYRSTSGLRSGIYRFHFQPHFSDGAQRGVLCFTEDISQVRYTENALKDRDTLLTKIFDTASVAIFLVDRAGVITHANRQMADMFHCPFEKLVGSEYVAHVHPAEREDGRQRMLQLLASQTQTVDLERLYWRDDGTQFWGRLTGRRFQDAQGNELGLVGVIADITDSKLANERRTLVIESAMDGFWVIDTGGRIRECNAALCTLSGYTRDEMLGMHISALDALETAEHAQAHIARIVSAGRDRFETRWRCRDGRLIEVEVTASHLSLAGEICAFVRDITALKAHQRELDHIAHYDPLTGAANRNLLSIRLEMAVAQARRTGALLAVCYLDLDGFKPINDTYGHDTGDHVLIEIASRLRAILRDSDTVARMGGDEFVLILQGFDHPRECETALARVLASIARPMRILDRDLALSGSLGVALFPQDDADTDTLLRHADQAMYLAKQSGRNRYHLFDPEHDRVARERTEQLTRIAGALRAREFVLYFQPQVRMRTGQVYGAEALIRWQHPERGLLPPADFLSVIEDNDLIAEIGDWVIATTLDQLEEWREHGLELRIGVNIAARHLLRGDFIERLRHHLAAHPQLPPQSLELEVLETAALEDIDRVSGIIRECGALGVGFSLDDFGTGYSSLAYLKTLPAETLKIDQTFVRDMLVDLEDRAIVEGVIGLARVFGRGVIAEGVETVEHGALLMRLGCDQAQGYGIARPMPSHDLPRWVRAWEPDPVWTEGAREAPAEEPDVPDQDAEP